MAAGSSSTPASSDAAASPSAISATTAAPRPWQVRCGSAASAPWSSWVLSKRSAILGSLAQDALFPVLPLLAFGDALCAASGARHPLAPHPHRRPGFANTARQRMVELVRAGRDPEELAREFEPTAQSIRNWVAQSDRDGGKREDGLTTVEREELRHLRREVRQLREEREILRKAAAWFARESKSNGRKPSDS